MGLDRLDWVAITGFCVLTAAAQLVALEAVVLAAGLGGFVLSLSLWRLYDGRVWEAIGWLAWLVAAVVLALGPAGSPLLILAFLGAILGGLSLLFGARTGRLPDVWTVSDE